MPVWKRAGIAAALALTVSGLAEHTFTTEGTFPYYCERHLSQGMTGTITVQGSSGGRTC